MTPRAPVAPAFRPAGDMAVVLLSAAPQRVAAPWP